MHPVIWIGSLVLGAWALSGTSKRKEPPVAGSPEPSRSVGFLGRPRYGATEIRQVSPDELGLLVEVPWGIVAKARQQTLKDGWTHTFFPDARGKFPIWAIGQHYYYLPPGDPWTDQWAMSSTYADPFDPPTRKRIFTVPSKDPQYFDLVDRMTEINLDEAYAGRKSRSDRFGAVTEEDRLAVAIREFRRAAEEFKPHYDMGDSVLNAKTSDSKGRPLVGVLTPVGDWEYGKPINYGVDYLHGEACRIAEKYRVRAAMSPVVSVGENQGVVIGLTSAWNPAFQTLFRGQNPELQWGRASLKGLQYQTGILPRPGSGDSYGKKASEI